MLDCQNNSTGRLAATSNILRNFIHAENPASSVNSIVEISRKFDQLANCIHSFGTYVWPVLLKVEKCFFFLRKPFKADFASSGKKLLKLNSLRKLSENSVAVEAAA